MGHKFSCLKGLKTCVSSREDSEGTPVTPPGNNHLDVPSIIVTPPTPTGTALSREPRQGDLGPFNPGLPVEVPAWLAISLKQRQKCRLVPPEWMDVEKLEEIRDQERKEDTFTPMPSPYYMELTKLLLNYASDNIPKADEIRTLVKETWDTRLAKLRLSADSFVRQQEAHAKLDNLTLMEINTTGTFLTQALDHMYKLRTNLQPGESAHSQDF
ncbi:PREDICTED: DNA replication complex GINS protein PSF2-like [Chaetura pelagica]|uniref:DNA replication complex GINS protein PSF2-like n=1 Tax=Chaetura pelagica TaxID=8897 RepID=UPI0005239CF3|nr:PREDICTED: DNA replication complex GINS protein PSF2-like [Chaetura pelagica]